MRGRETDFNYVAHIKVGPRHREPKDIEELAESISILGMQTPITVRHIIYPEDHPGNELDRLELVTGARRLAAAKKLGWELIECFTVLGDDWDEIDAELWEIAENLHRQDLTALERDEQLARWLELQEQKLAKFHSSQNETNEKGGRTDGRGGRREGGIRRAARDLGIDKSDASRAIRVAGLSESAKQVARETGMDGNRSVLIEARAKGKGDAKIEVAHIRKAASLRETRGCAVTTEIDLEFADWLCERIDKDDRFELISYLRNTNSKLVATEIEGRQKVKESQDASVIPAFIRQQ